MRTIFLIVFAVLGCDDDDFTNAMPSSSPSPTAADMMGQPSTADMTIDMAIDMAADMAVVVDLAVPSTSP
jgi:hypothetical protein